MIRRVLALGALLSATLLSTVAADEPPPTCDIRANNCPRPTQVLTYLKNCPRTGGEAACPEIHLPPPAEISCGSSQGYVVCDAWPESDGLSYRYVWSVLAGRVTGGSASEFSPAYFGTCSGRAARIAVTVIAPNGTASTASVAFACEQDQ